MPACLPPQWARHHASALLCVGCLLDGGESRYEEQTAEFCQDRGPFCAAELPGHAARACREAAGRRSARLLVEMTDEPDLLPLRGHEAGTGQPREFIVEWREGTSDAARVAAQVGGGVCTRVVNVMA